MVRDFVLMPFPGDENIYVAPTASGQLTSRIIPADLSERVMNDSGIYWRSVEIPTAGSQAPGSSSAPRCCCPRAGNTASTWSMTSPACKAPWNSSTAPWCSPA
ncbi:hypothetical protein [Arthrobacter sp. JCM 19049]|uniref:hypothetical protein n=1 Tax=Arthrobacter sp. JCM 19049 TaxID=1460643 RepID=UPI0024367DDE|nr:hypothetical protein [Arthrobacter sp. JCM 19049]